MKLSLTGAAVVACILTPKCINGAEQAHGEQRGLASSLEPLRQLGGHGEKTHSKKSHDNGKKSDDMGKKSNGKGDKKNTCENLERGPMISAPTRAYTIPQIQGR